MRRCRQQHAGKTVQSAGGKRGEQPGGPAAGLHRGARSAGGSTPASPWIVGRSAGERRHSCPMNELPATFKVVTVWLLVAVAVFLGVQFWQRQAERTRFAIQGGELQIARSSDGHYHWPGRINGRRVDFLIDTGASRTAMPLQLARELELKPLGRVEVLTAGGRVSGDWVLADLELEGAVRIDRLRITALPALGAHPLLGMDVLGRLRWSQHGGVLRIDLREFPAP